MHTINRSLAVLVTVAAVLALAGVTLTARADTTSTFSANQTVANQALGTNNQTLATSSSVSNVAQVKATRTLAVGAVPANAETITIGLCVVTFNTAASADSDCSNNNAAINTTTNSSTALVAAALRALTGVTDTGHGGLTVTGATTNAIFTTTGTEAAATAITFTDGTTGDITSSSSTSGTVPVAQVWTSTPANVDVGDTFTLIINGTTVSFTATAATVANVTAGLSAAINASAQASAVTAVDGTTLVTITSDAAGTAFTGTTGTTNASAIAQVVVFTPGSFSADDEFNIRINGVDYIENGGTVQEVVELLTADINADASAVITCSEDDAAVTCTADSAGTAFTYAAFVLEHHGGGSSGSSHHGGGGGSSSGTGSDDSSTVANLMAQIAKLQAMLAALTGGHPSDSAVLHASGNASFTRDLDLGAVGDDVKALQTMLIAAGFNIEAGATGYFGGQTQAALAKWQAANGITPAAGYFGPKTRAAVK